MTSVQRAAVVGAGTMGLGVAECFALAGLQVNLVDANFYQSHVAWERLKHRIRGHIDAGLLDESAMDALANARVADGITAAVADADLVFEAAPERIEIKRDVLAQCDADAPADAIIASNTSSLPIDELAASVTRKDRFLGMHFFNPPEWIPGVEVIPSVAYGYEDHRARERLPAGDWQAASDRRQRTRLRRQSHPVRALPRGRGLR